MDPRFGLPSVTDVELGGVTFVVTHGTGSPRGWPGRVVTAVREHAPDADARIGIASHTHEVVDRVHDGVRILNPGSATGAAPAERTTMLTAEVADGDCDVTIHEA